jgi:hypothetical protein
MKSCVLRAAKMPIRFFRCRNRMRTNIDIEYACLCEQTLLQKLQPIVRICCQQQ